MRRNLGYKNCLKHGRKIKRWHADDADAFRQSERRPHRFSQIFEIKPEFQIFINRTAFYIFLKSAKICVAERHLRNLRAISLIFAQ